jgi:hypothetical protein
MLALSSDYGPSAFVCLCWGSFIPLCSEGKFSLKVLPMHALSGTILQVQQHSGTQTSLDLKLSWLTGQ